MKRFQVKGRLIAVLMLFSIIVVGSEVCEGATYFVAATGSDSYSCFQSQSASTPRRTINDGLHCLKSGDTLQVGSGTYKESIFSINGTTVPNGSPGAYTKIVGIGKVFLAPTGSIVSLNAGIYLGGASSYVEFNGIGTDGRYQNALLKPGCCGLVLDGAYQGSIHHIRLLNAEFMNNKCGSMGFGYATDIEIDGNYIHGDECYSYSHGLYVGSFTARFTITNNVIEGFTDYGMQFYSASGPTASDSVVHNNLFRSNGSAAFGGGGMSIGGVNNRVYDNDVVGNLDGIRIQYSGAMNVQVSGNNLVSNAYQGIFVGDSAGNSVVRDNVLYNNGRNSIEDRGWGTVLVNNLITSTLPPSKYATPSAPAQVTTPADPPQVTAPTEPPQVTTPSDPSQLPTPGGLVAQCAQDGRTVVLKWSPVQGANIYYLRINYLANDNLDSWYVDGLDYYLDAYGSTAFTAPIQPGQRYNWWVHGANSSTGIGPASSGSFTCVPQ